MPTVLPGPSLGAVRVPYRPGPDQAGPPGRRAQGAHPGRRTRAHGSRPLLVLLLLGGRALALTRPPANPTPCAAAQLAGGVRAIQIRERYFGGHTTSCFFLLREGGEAEDVSYRKCVANLYKDMGHLMDQQQQCGGGGGGRGSGGGGSGRRGSGRGRGRGRGRN